ncbi:ATP-binding protein [Kordiimonas pumila]|uniref:histidine kinase n=1 Tax=Kordiimonas pumila TaxID=2161677 RepID=A0ABV7D4M7_9PROT|nr:ATP-binding protein [Kordiimonas pumila]
MSNTQGYDLLDVRVEQALLLKNRTTSSCLFVLFIICNYFIILYFTGYENKAVYWLILASIMVGLVWLYGVRASSITRETVDRYLHGHTLLCCITGLVWGGFSIYLIDWSSYFTIFVACVLVFSITVGGMLPSSAYRPGYIGLALFSLLPLASYILIYASWPVHLLGLATLVYFAFGMIASARSELDMREAITARNSRDLTEKIKAKNEIIQRVNEEKNRFLAATSHDLSQPIHAQGYFIQALKKQLTSPEQHNLLDKIELTWQRQSQFLRGLMDVNQLDSGTLKAKPAHINIAEEMQLVIDEFTENNKQKHLKLSCHFEAGKIYTDPAFLNRIVRNLLSNAIKYTPPYGTINIEAQKKSDHTIITITDSGPGIPEADQKRVFDEYVQLDNSLEVTEDGVGLGLSIVKRLCALLNIQVSLVSNPGEGTRFTLTIPQTAAIGLTDDKTGTPSAGNVQFDHTPLIVIVDDETAIRDAMSGLFTDWGCQVICGACEEDVLPIISATAEVPDLLVIDKMLSRHASGIDLIHTLREEVNEDTPAVLMSGAALTDAEKQATIGMTFLNKPIAPPVLQRILQEAVQTQNRAIKGH